MIILHFIRENTLRFNKIKNPEVAFGEISEGG
jgi:hypothetical protein